MTVMARRGSVQRAAPITRNTDACPAAFGCAQENKGNAKHVEMIKTYRGKVEVELNVVCGPLHPSPKNDIFAPH